MTARCLTFVAALLLSVPAAVAGGGQTVRVGVYDFAPLSHTDVTFTAEWEKNCAERDCYLFTELLAHIARAEEWTLEYVPGTLDECLGRLRSGTVDLVAAAAYAPELEDGIRFTRETLISTWASVYTGGNVTVERPVDLKGLVVGIVRDDPYNRALRRVMQQYNATCEFVEFNRYADVFHALRHGWIDAGVADRLYVPPAGYRRYAAPTAVSFAPVELRYAGSADAGANLLSTIDFYVSAFKQDPESVYYRLISGITGGTRGNPVLLRYLRWGLSAALALLLMAAGVMLVLRREVGRKTRALVQTNRQLRDEMDERRNMAEKLRKANKLLAKTFASMHDGMLIFSAADRLVINSNRAAGKMLGHASDALIGMSLGQLADPDEDVGALVRSVAHSLRTRGFHTGNVRFVRGDGRSFKAEIMVTPIQDDDEPRASWVMIVRDITTRERLRQSELRLQQAQKMEAIGTLAGGIAHDFNNMLTPVIGFADLLLREERPDTLRFERLSAIREAGYRARDLISQILTFSRQDGQVRRPLRLGIIVKEALKLLRSSLPSTIEIDVRAGTREDTVYADPTQIHQVLMNLCSNAAHAMRDRSGGILEVTLQAHEGDGVIGWTDGRELEPGRKYVRLSVRDTGHGIPPDIMHRIFDPFFTTKGTNEGTGMGLSVVHGIVKGYKGLIGIETAAESGTAFHVYLPLAGMGQPDAPTVLGAKGGSVPRGRQETVLVVDDEPMVLDTVKNVLEAQGYHVVARATAATALVTFQSSPKRFGLVLTDQTMPGLTGTQLARNVLAIRPDLPVVIMTGFSEAITRERTEAMGIKALVMKPLVPDELAALVRRLLDDAAMARQGV